MPVVGPLSEKRFSIVSGGTAQSTRVYDADGKLVKWGGSGLSKIEIKPIEPDGLVTAIFTVDFVGLDLGVTEAQDAEPSLA